MSSHRKILQLELVLQIFLVNTKLSYSKTDHSSFHLRLSKTYHSTYCDLQVSMQDT